MLHLWMFLRPFKSWYAYFWFIWVNYLDLGFLDESLGLEGFLNEVFEIGFEKFEDNILNEFGIGIILGVEDMLNKRVDYVHLDNVIHALDDLKDLKLSTELVANFLNSFEGTLFVWISVLALEHDTWDERNKYQNNQHRWLA